jgi:hypothetical protein
MCFHGGGNTTAPGGNGTRNDTECEFSPFPSIPVTTSDAPGGLFGTSAVGAVGVLVAVLIVVLTGRRLQGMASAPMLDSEQGLEWAVRLEGVCRGLKALDGADLRRLQTALATYHRQGAGALPAVLDAARRLYERVGDHPVVRKRVAPPGASRP